MVPRKSPHASETCLASCSFLAWRTLQRRSWKRRYSFGMSTGFRHTTGCSVPEYRTLHNNRCDNLKFYSITYLFSCFYVLNNANCIVLYEVLRFSLLLSLYISLFFDIERERKKCMLLAQSSGRSPHELYLCN